MDLIDPPSASLLFETQSPSYDAPPPEIRYAERIPADIAAACGAQRQGHFEPRPVRIWLLRDVVVAYEGLVFDRDGNLFRQSVTQHHALEIDWARARMVDGPDMPHLTHPVVLGKKRGAANYGHFLLEILPMLQLARDRIRSDTLGALVHDVDDPQLGGVMQDSLRRIGVPDRLVGVSGLMPVRVDRLLLVEGLTVHGTYMSPLVAACIAVLRAGTRGAGHERVFIARGNEMRRDFRDSARVESLAREAGFHVMNPDGLTLPEQIACLHDARIVAGAMGAAMTNLVFAGAGARILMFAGATMPDTFFWFASTVFGHHYREMRCDQAERVQGLFYDRALLVPDDDVRSFLASS